MSNPAVIKLQKGKIHNSRVWLDDNFGEAIHIHIDDHRVDLTVNEFEQLYVDLCETMNDLRPIEGLDYSDIDPVFFALWIYPNLSSITHIKHDKVFLEDLWAPYGDKCYKLKDSVGVRALQGVSNENEGFRKSHHIGQTDSQRMQGILDSIKEHGYPYKNRYIILYGDLNKIYDGQHRASCLYHLYGNIEVPVIRIYSSSFNYKEPTDKTRGIATSLFLAAKYYLMLLLTFVRNICIKITSLFVRVYRRILYIFTSKQKPYINQDADVLFSAK